MTYKIPSVFKNCIYICNLHVLHLLLTKKCETKYKPLWINRSGKKDSFPQPLRMIWIVLKEITMSTCVTVCVTAWSSKIMVHWEQKIMLHDSQVTSGYSLGNMCNMSERRTEWKEKEYLLLLDSLEGWIPHPYGNAELVARYMCVFTLGQEKIKISHMHYLVDIWHFLFLPVEF